MIGIELIPDLPVLDHDSAKTASQIMVQLLHEEGQLSIPAGANVVRWLPTLNVTAYEIDEAVSQLAAALRKLDGRVSS